MEINKMENKNININAALFRQIATNETVLSPLMADREKLKTEDIIKKYPNGVTVTGFDFVTVDNSTFPVLTFKENEKACFFGGHILTNICKSWVEPFDGDVEEASNALKSVGGVKMIFTAEKTKDGTKNITTVKVV